MPMFQTFADYDKWRRRQLLLRLEKLQNLPLRPDSIVKVAEKAGDPSIKYGQLSRGLQDGISPDVFHSDGISKGLQDAINTVLNEGDPLSAALKYQSDGRTPDTLDPNAGKQGKPPAGSKGKDKENKENKGKQGGGQGPGGRGPAEDPVPDTDRIMAYREFNFDLSRGGDWTGSTGSDNFTVSFWFSVPLEPIADHVFFMSNFATRQDRFRLMNDEAIQFDGKDSAGGVYAADVKSATGLITADTIHHVMVQASLNNNEMKLWLDGTAVVDTTYATASQPIGTEANWHLWHGGGGSGGLIKNSRIGAFWLSEEYVATPVGVFIDSSGNPLTAGADGSTYTGTQPLCFMNEIADWNAGTNRGTGGNLTKNGTELVSLTEWP